MNYLDFRKSVEDFPLFETRDLRLFLGEKFSKSILNNLEFWRKKGYLMRIRKGLYLPADLLFKISPISIASKIYYPSYVSMESAMGYYGIIPEAVFTTTSITTRKTKKIFVEKLGSFTYQKIKKEAFGGYETHKDRNLSYNLALPEKSLVDFLYLNRGILNGSREQFKSYRFNEDYKFSKKNLIEFMEKFKNNKLSFLVKSFIKNYVAK